MSRTKSAYHYPERWRMEAWFCQMDFADVEMQYTPDWTKVLCGMPFWARQLLAVMVSMYVIQLLIDDDNSAQEKQLIIEQLEMWRV